MTRRVFCLLPLTLFVPRIAIAKSRQTSELDRRLTMLITELRRIEGVLCDGRSDYLRHQFEPQRTHRSAIESMERYFSRDFREDYRCEMQSARLSASSEPRFDVDSPKTD